MKTLSSFIVIFLITCASCQDDGGEEHPQGGHDQPPTNQPGQEGQDQDSNQGNNTNGQQGFSQEINQGIKPYSYGYNTGIKPYSYQVYQPYGGKPQVVTSDDGKSNGKQSEKRGPQATPPPIQFEFPPDLASFLGPIGPITIPQQSPQQQQQPQPTQPQAPQQRAQQQPPPPFNYAEYGIPTDIGSATGGGAPGIFGVQPQQQQQQQQPSLFGGNGAGDDFGIFGGGNNNNNNNAFSIPILEDGNANQNQNPLSILGGSAPSPSNDFSFGNNDFNVAASDFEPFNIRNFVPEEFTNIQPAAPLTTNQVAPLQNSGVSQPNQGANVHPHLQQNVPTTTSKTSHPEEEKMRRKMMYMKRKETKRSRRALTIEERPHEKPLKDNPQSAWAILNMDPQYTNPNQGVYSYYPAYRIAS